MTVSTPTKKLTARPGSSRRAFQTKTDKLPSGSQLLHEIKHDGFRIIACVDKHRIVKGAIPMTTYWTRVRVRAWTDTLRDCGFRDMRTSVVKIIWIIIGLVIALYLGGAEVLIEHAGKLGTGIAVFLVFFIILFLWNLVTAPAKLQQEADNEIAALKTKLNDREARQSAMARLWALRAEGTAMRNQKVVGANAGWNGRSSSKIGMNACWQKREPYHQTFMRGWPP
jgi:hypothetical protein